jgi:hypothetical protein
VKHRGTIPLFATAELPGITTAQASVIGLQQVFLVFEGGSMPHVVYALESSSFRRGCGRGGVVLLVVLSVDRFIFSEGSEGIFKKQFIFIVLVEIFIFFISSSFTSFTFVL